MINQFKHLAKRGYIGATRNYQMFRDTAILHKSILPAHFEDQFKKNITFLQPHHHYYITEISVDFMAVSLELAAFLLTFCEVVRPNGLLIWGRDLVHLFYAIILSISHQKQLFGQLMIMQTGCKRPFIF